MRLLAASPVTKVPDTVIDRPPTTVMIDPVGFRFSMQPNCMPTAVIMRVLIEALTERRTAWASTPKHWWGYVEIPAAARKFLAESDGVHAQSGERTQVSPASPCPTEGIGFMEIDAAQCCVGSINLLGDETVPLFAKEYRKECASACRSTTPGNILQDEKSPQFCAIENAGLRSDIYALHRDFFSGPGDLAAIFQKLILDDDDDEPPTRQAEGPTEAVVGGGVAVTAAAAGAGDN